MIGMLKVGKMFEPGFVGLPGLQTLKDILSSLLREIAAGNDEQLN